MQLTSQQFRNQPLKYKSTITIRFSLQVVLYLILSIIIFLQLSSIGSAATTVTSIATAFALISTTTLIPSSCCSEQQQHPRKGMTTTTTLHETNNNNNNNIDIAELKSATDLEQQSPMDEVEVTSTGTVTNEQQQQVEQESPQLLQLPPSDDNENITTIQFGETISFTELGPIILNTDGTTRRIENWNTLSKQEQETTWRRIKQRNAIRRQHLLELQQQQEAQLQEQEDHDKNNETK